jgi:hypothetical protein
MASNGVPKMVDLSECQCGRLANKPHCPTCGSAQVLASARKRDYVTRGDGTTAELQVYRCRVCGLSFNDDQRTLCAAPPPRMAYRTPDQPRGLVTRDADIKAAKILELTSDPNALEREWNRLRKGLAARQATEEKK